MKKTAFFLKSREKDETKQKNECRIYMERSPAALP